MSAPPHPWITVVSVRSVRLVLGVWFATVVLVTSQARARMPFVTVPYLPGGNAPSGPFLLGLIPVACAILWRDVTAPLTATTPRPAWQERAVLITLSAVLTAIPATLVAVRLLRWLPASVVIGHATLWLGLCLLLSSFFGTVRGATVTVAVVLFGFVAATVGGVATATLDPAHAVQLNVAGAATLIAGAIVATTRGLDPGRARRGDITGVTDS